jgi:4-hydroxythreonine-4-phosphate dehydrogenase
MPELRPICVTCGEPAGVSAEITVKAWQTLRDGGPTFFLIGDADWLSQRARSAGLEVSVQTIATADEAVEVFDTALPVLHRALPIVSEAGKLDKRNAPTVINAIREAVDFCLSGAAGAVVTNPIQKDVLYGAGFAFQGHTDFLGALARERGHDACDVMMLAAGDFRVVPITVHIPLKDVAATLTGKMIVDQARVVHHDLMTYFGVPRPRIAVTGLNPHAGENGALGHEDDAIIKPAIAMLQSEGINAFGPLPADTAFHAEARAGYDVVLCMYHDQALIPVKMLDFYGGVNITLGLPFVRTSPDHGTALGISGTGQARADSLIKAIQVAGDMATAKSAS